MALRGIYKKTGIVDNPVCTGDLPAGVLARHVQLHVQPHDLLLHEPEVRL